MAELSPRDLVRTRIEHALASEQVNLTSSAGRSRAEELHRANLARLPGRGARRGR